MFEEPKFYIKQNKPHLRKKNQVLVRFVSPAGDGDALTREVIARIQTDIDRSVAAILACTRAAG